MLRKSTVILAMLFGFMATQVYALGLGTVTVESALNQPLRVRIEILDLGETRLEDVNISMASGDDFQRFNVDRALFLNNIRFEVVAASQGNFVILTSNQIVREPYLSFILDTRWPSGRLLSEHTVLLDLPAFDDQQQSTPAILAPVSPVAQAPVNNDTPVFEAEEAEPQPAEQVTAPTVTEPAATQEPAAVAQQESLAGQEPSADEEPSANQEPEAVANAIDAGPGNTAEPIPDTIETLPNDTLTDIAQRVRPDSSVTLQQTMIALQELNPDAFAGSNINRLRAGEVMRVPTLNQIQDVDPRQAIDEISRQNQALASAEPLAAPTQSAGNADDGAQGQLSVVTGDEDTDGAGGSDAELDQRIAALENQLALQEEAADRARIERAELDSRMAELEGQIAAAQEVIRLQDLQLAQLQESLAQAAAEQEAAQAAALAAQQAANQQSSPTAGSGGVAGSLMNLFTSNLYIYGALGVVALLIAFFLVQRTRAARAGAADEDSHDLDDFDSDDLDSELDTIIGKAEPEAKTEFFGSSASDTKLERDDVAATMLDDMGIDLEFFDDEDDEDDEETEKPDSDATPSDSAEDDFDLDDDTAPDTDSEEAAEDDDELDLESFAAELDDDEESAPATQADESDSFEFDLDETPDADDDGEQASDSDGDKAESDQKLETFDFDLDDEDDADKATEAEAEPAKATDNDELETFDFDLDDDDDADKVTEAEAEPAKAADNDELETFDFDLGDDDDADKTQAEAPAAESAAASDDNSLDFDTFDIEEEAADSDAKSEENSDEKDDDLETFDFDLDDYTADTVVEKPQKEAPASASDDGVSFDLDEPDDTDSEEAGAEEVGESDDSFDLEFDVDETDEPDTKDDTEDKPQGVLDDEDMEIEAIDFDEITDLSDDDEAATKLELAYAYQKMGDPEGAKEILQEVIKEGNEKQIKEAQDLLSSLDKKA